jgi:hypothetical protein
VRNYARVSLFSNRSDEFGKARNHSSKSRKSEGKATEISERRF